MESLTLARAVSGLRFDLTFTPCDLPEENMRLRPINDSLVGPCAFPFIPAPSLKQASLTVAWSGDHYMMRLEMLCFMCGRAGLSLDNLASFIVSPLTFLVLHGLSAFIFELTRLGR